MDIIMKIKSIELLKIIKKLVSVKQKYILYAFNYTISMVCDTIAIVFFSKILSSALFEKNLSFEKVLVLVIILSIILIISNFSKEYYKNKGNAAIASIKSYYSIKLHDKITSMPYKYVENSDFLDKHQNIFSVVDSYGSGIDGFCQNLFDLSANMIICFIFIFLLVRIHVFCVFLMVFSLILCFFISKKMLHIKTEKNNEIGISKRRQSYFFRISHEARNGKEIRIFNIRKILINDYTKEIKRYINSLRSFYKTELFEKFLENIFNYIGIIGVLYFLLVGIQEKTFQVSDIIMYLQVLFFINDKFNEFATNIITILNESVYINLLFEFLSETDNKTSSQFTECLHCDSIISVKDLFFSYPCTKVEIIKDVNFTIEKEDKVAIVGANGAGKSSIIKLLTGIYDDYKGEIIVNGKDIRRYSQEDKQNIYSVVLQNICIYPFTLKENVAESSDKIDMEKLNHAIILSGLQDKVSNLENGVNTYLKKVFHHDAVELSGGEEQKLALAKVIYKNSPILIFDEPTSKMDVKAEENFYTNILKLFNDKTIILVTHRLSSIKYCNKILFLNDGTVAEYGTFDDLMEKKGLFYEMYNKQKNLYS